MQFEDIPSQSVCSTVAYSGCVYAYAKDILGPLPESGRGNHYILIIGKKHLH